MTALNFFHPYISKSNEGTANRFEKRAFSTVRRRLDLARASCIMLYNDFVSPTHYSMQSQWAVVVVYGLCANTGTTWIFYLCSIPEYVCKTGTAQLCWTSSWRVVVFAPWERWRVASTSSLPTSSTAVIIYAFLAFLPQLRDQSHRHGVRIVSRSLVPDNFTNIEFDLNCRQCEGNKIKPNRWLACLGYSHTKHYCCLWWGHERDGFL